LVKKKGQYSKFIVTAVIVLNIIFTAAVLFVFYKTSNEPSTLIASWFGFTTGELLLLSSIKKSKIKKGSGEKP
jgi:hypothetical protein